MTRGQSLADRLDDVVDAGLGLLREEVLDLLEQRLPDRALEPGLVVLPARPGGRDEHVVLVVVGHLQVGAKESGPLAGRCEYAEALEGVQQLVPPAGLRSKEKEASCHGHDYD